MFNPRLWEIGLMVLFGTLISFYICMDLKFMVEKRAEEYQPGDWLVGIVHLHTDIFFRFWKDMFSEEKSEDISQFLEE